MASLETRMRSRLVKVLSPLHAIPVENRVGATGTPDINYIGGWIECKRRDLWPKNPSHIVTFQHPITLNQKIWRNARVRKGGTVILAVYVGRDWLFYSHREIYERFGTLTQQEMIDLANFKFLGLRGWTLVQVQELIEWLTLKSKG